MFTRKSTIRLAPLDILETLSTDAFVISLKSGVLSILEQEVAGVRFQSVVNHVAWPLLLA